MRNSMLRNNKIQIKEVKKHTTLKTTLFVQRFKSPAIGAILCCTICVHRSQIFKFKPTTHSDYKVAQIRRFEYFISF